MQTVWLELYCLMNGIRFSLRHPRYAVILLYVYGASITKWKRGRLARYGYVYLQVIDDIIDGDREVIGEPDQVVQSILHSFRENSSAGRMITKLGFALRNELEMRANDIEDPVEVVEKLVENMLRDYPRLKNREALPEFQLIKHMRETFELSMDLLFIASDAQVRSRDFPTLISALAWCSRYRDLKDDIKMGIVNIPKECIELSPMLGQAVKHGDARQLTKHQGVSRWLEKDFQNARKDLEIYYLERMKHRGAKGLYLADVFAKSIQKYQIKYNRTQVTKTEAHQAT